jgi:signal transduction histidine kinase
VDESLRLFRMLVPPTLEMRTHTVGKFPRVAADAALAVQLVMNLCTNGYQAMSGPGGTLTVALRNRTVAPPGNGDVAPGNYVVLVVSDTGHGMDAATMQRIFEPFFTTREVGRGSGLGLAVVHGIAKSFGATIVVDSEPGRGTTFSVYFPVAPHPAHEGRQTPAAPGVL